MPLDGSVAAPASIVGGPWMTTERSTCVCCGASPIAVPAGDGWRQITLSAYMRLSQAGLGCADWPACYGIALRGATQPLAPAGACDRRWRGSRTGSSRRWCWSASIVMLLATPASSPRAAATANAHWRSALVGLALALAALGIVTPGARLPAVTLGNLLGGFAMLALCARLAVGRARRCTARARRLGHRRDCCSLALADRAAGAQDERERTRPCPAPT
jgi:hypothetical protein